MATEDLWNTNRRLHWALAALATVIGLAAIAIADWQPVDTWLLLPAIALFWPWAAFERFPAWLLYVTAATTPIVVNVVDGDSGEEVSMFLVVLIVAISAAFEPRRRAVFLFVSSLVVAILVFTVTGAFDDVGWQNWVFGMLFSWGFGEIVFRLRQTVDELNETRALVADQAALQERRRIARDVHDLVGHSLSVVMLQVTGARHLIHRDPDEAERALIQAETAGRESLAEIRQTVGLLRDESDGGLANAPSPDLGDIDILVAEFRAAGVDVAVTSAGPTDAVEPAIGLAGYRIVQEALTNAARHAVGGRVEVTVEVGDSTCELAVRSIGGTSKGDTTGAGIGLVGMRERAKSVGGSLTAGPIAGGWLVEASLPLVSDRSHA